MVTLSDDFWNGVAWTLGVEFVLVMFWISIDMFVLVRIRRYRHERRLQAQADYEAERALLQEEIRQVVQAALGEDTEADEPPDEAEGQLGTIYR